MITQMQAHYQVGGIIADPHTRSIRSVTAEVAWRDVPEGPYVHTLTCTLNDKEKQEFLDFCARIQARFAKELLAEQEGLTLR